LNRFHKEEKGKGESRAFVREGGGGGGKGFPKFVLIWGEGEGKGPARSRGPKTSLPPTQKAGKERGGGEEG